MENNCQPSEEKFNETNVVELNEDTEKIDYQPLSEKINGIVNNFPKITELTESELSRRANNVEKAFRGIAEELLEIEKLETITNTEFLVNLNKEVIMAVCPPCPSGGHGIVK